MKEFEISDNILYVILAIIIFSYFGWQEYLKYNSPCKCMDNEIILKEVK